jgi:riboflavin kinase/FMN adenylyltransferase
LGLELQKQHQDLNLSVMNLVTVEQSEIGVYPLKTINNLINENYSQINYLIQSLVEVQLNQEEFLESLKHLLNVQKIVINDNFMIGTTKLDPQLLRKVFGNENLIFANYLKPTKALKTIQAVLETGKMKTYFEKTKTYFSLKGEVIHGKKLGRQLGYPTANVLVNPKILLKQGVYFTKIKLPNDDHLYSAMSCY